jgi:hypothetical protein
LIYGDIMKFLISFAFIGLAIGSTSHADACALKATEAGPFVTQTLREFTQQARVWNIEAPIITAACEGRINNSGCYTEFIYFSAERLRKKVATTSQCELDEGVSDELGRLARNITARDGRTLPRLVDLIDIMTE